MQTLETDGPVRPLLIYHADDSFCLATLTNTKGYNKSLENGVLWVLDGITGRLLPLTDHDARVATALTTTGKKTDSRYVAALSDCGEFIHAKVNLPPLTAKAASSTDSGKLPEVSQAIVSSSAVETASDQSERLELASFLYELQDLIRRRQIEMPEGSYTTHLFKAGLGKIRKKTGEEAIELLLAQQPAEISSEAADLIYHLMVLLVATGVPVEQVLADLKKR